MTCSVCLFVLFGFWGGSAHEQASSGGCSWLPNDVGDTVVELMDDTRCMGALVTDTAVASAILQPYVLCFFYTRCKSDDA